MFVPNKMLHQSRYLLFFLVFLSFGLTSSYAGKMEVFSMTTTNSDFKSFSFQQSYDQTPLVFSLATTSGGDVSALRLRNITTTGFEIAAVEPHTENGPHTNMNTAYLAIEPGEYFLPDGTRIVAGAHETTNMFKGSEANGDIVNLAGFSEAPTMLAQIQTMRNEQNSNVGDSQPSSPWMTAGIKNISNSSFELALERSTFSDSDPSQTEKVAYLAMESPKSNSFVDSSGNNITYEAIKTANKFRDYSDSAQSESFQQSYSNSPLVVATKTSRNSSNGGWLRMHSLSSSSVDLKIDARSRNFSGEAADIMAFSQSFTLNNLAEASAVPEPSSWLLLVLSLLTFGFVKKRAT